MVKRFCASSTSQPEQVRRFVDHGFTRAEWTQFAQDGLIVRRGVFGPAEITAMKARCQEFEVIASEIVGVVEGGYREVLATSPVFSHLVCDSRLIGPAYDLYGEMTALHGFDMFVRPAGSSKEHTWHIDGPRRLPYSTFSPSLPLVIKFGVWLTDVEDSSSGAYRYVPGSHLEPCLDAYGVSARLPNEQPLLVQAGDVSIHHSDLWHCVGPNDGNATRYNFFVSYSPAWISPRETFAEVEPLSDLPILETLLRRYPDLTRRFKPPLDEPAIHPQADAALLSGARFGSAPIGQAVELWNEIKIG